MLNRRCPEGSKVYVVKSGDTLTKIALDLDVSIDELLALNPTVNPYMLMIGQELCVPTSSSITCPNGFVYTIQRGDDFYKIAQKHGLTVRELMMANPLLDPYRLRIGQKICIPTHEHGCPPNSKEYIVKDGDTFYLIAKEFDISYKCITDANPNMDVENLRIGEKLCIPPSKPSKVCPRGSNSYIIEQGEDLTAVAEKLTISAVELLKLNPELTPSEFVAGRLICVPRVTRL